MFRLVLPKKKIENIREICNFDDNKWELFIEYIQKITPDLNKDEIVTKISKILEIEEQRSSEYLNFIISLYINRFFVKTTTEDFINDSIIPSCSKKDLEEIGNQIIFQKLKTLLSFNKNIGILAKISGIKHDRDNPFLGSRIISEFQPIFYDDISEEYEFGLICHTLRLKILGNDNRIKDKFISLRSKDLDELEELIQRAKKKEINMKNMLSKQYKILDDEEW